MKKTLAFIAGISLLTMFVAVGFSLSCDIDGGADAKYDSLTVDRDTVPVNDTVTLTAYVSGPEKNVAEYWWDADAGEFIPRDEDTNVVRWIAPDTIGIYDIECTVTLNVPNYIAKSVSVTVIKEE